MPLRSVLFGPSVFKVVPATRCGGDYSGNFSSDRRDGTLDSLTPRIHQALVLNDPLAGAEGEDAFQWMGDRYAGTHFVCRVCNFPE
jgi:hypothetical protein